MSFCCNVQSLAAQSYEKEHTCKQPMKRGFLKPVAYPGVSPLTKSSEAMAPLSCITRTHCV